MARVTLIGLAGVNAIWDWRMEPWRCSEDEQFHAMWDSLPQGAICIFDRYFSSFYNLAKLRHRHISVISRLHHRRDPFGLIRRGRPLGPNQWLVPLELDDQSRQRYQDPTLPARLWVRLIAVPFRHGGQRRRHWLVTTLVDPARYPASEIAQLYRRRWEVETRLGEIKTTLQADVLRSKTPQGVRRELQAILLGHNLVWWLLHLAGKRTNQPAQKIRFAAAVKTILSFSQELARTSRARCRRVFDRMLCQIAAHTNHHLPGRREPRLIKRNPVRYAFLRIPRPEARLKCVT